MSRYSELQTRRWTPKIVLCIQSINHFRLRSPYKLKRKIGKRQIDWTVLLTVVISLSTLGFRGKDLTCLWYCGNDRIRGCIERQVPASTCRRITRRHYNATDVGDYWRNGACLLDITWSLSKSITQAHPHCNVLCNAFSAYSGTPSLRMPRSCRGRGFRLPWRITIFRFLFFALKSFRGLKDRVH